MTLLIACNGWAQTGSWYGPPTNVPSIPWPIQSSTSEALERELLQTIDSLAKYRQLYAIERQISAAYRAADQISQRQYKTADAALTAERKRAGVLDEELNDAIGRAQSAEDRLKPLERENARLKGKTKVGRLLRKVRNGLAGVGGLVVAGITLKLIL